VVEYAWGYDSGDANLLKTHVCHIREKLDLPLEGETGIKSVPGVGYRFVPTT
jgi:DNA-binding response OmpR family regulator